MKLYHYTSFESFVKIWLSAELRFSIIDNMNDPLENRKRFNYQNPDSKNTIIKLLKSYRQISLTRDYCEDRPGYTSMMMWGHYANKGKGVCIEFEFDALNLDNIDCLHAKVNYHSKFPSMPCIEYDVVDENEIDGFIIEHKEDFFFSKLDDWSGENEYRIVSNSLKSIDIKNAITAVYVTNALTDECRFVEELTGCPERVRLIEFIPDASRHIIPQSRMSAKEYRD